MEIAIVHDDLMRRGGAEQVTLALHKIFPEAPIYTLCYNASLTYPEFKSAEVRTSIFQNFVKTEKWMKLLFYPLGFWCMRILKVKGFDKVILSSTYASKYVSISRGTEIINYCHNPFRLAWYPESYSTYNGISGVKKWIFHLLIKNLKRIDYKFSRRVDRTIVNSKVVYDRVKDIYKIEPDAIINPPVNMSNFAPLKLKNENYLVVSRFEPYKLVDLVIRAFNVSGKSLTIVGSGSQKEELITLAKSNISFKEGLDIDELAYEYASARALIFPQIEDFGITPLEANASGTPVIAFGQGGALETIVSSTVEGGSQSTGCYFLEQTVGAINDAIDKFECRDDFLEGAMVDNAKRFSVEKFSKKIKTIILS